MNEVPQSPLSGPPNQKKIGLRISITGLVVILLAISFLSGYVFAYYQFPISSSVETPLTLDAFKDNSRREAESRDIDFALFWDVWDTLFSDHVDRTRLKEQTLFYGAIKGMVDAVGDPHTVFFDPDASKAFVEELHGKFQGIGAEISIKNNRLTVVTPLAGGPADKAGLRAGDFILSIDGQSTADLFLDEAVNMIRGQKGTSVTLTVIHQGENSSQDIVIVRDEINVPIVQWSVDDDRIAYISLTNFNENSSKEFFAALNQINRQDIAGLIIDLRNDPGGYLDESVKIASAWVPEKEVIVREIYIDASQNVDYRATKQIAAPKVPTIVLVNEGSASASEILAGALQDYELATIVGETTFGKGSVQNLLPMPNQTSLKVTVAKWLTPKGRTIEGQGIEPDITVERTLDDFNNDRDPQLDAAKGLILGTFEQ